MKRPKLFASWPVRRKLLLLLLVGLMPAFGIITASGLNQRREELARLQENARLVVQSLAARQEQIAVTAKTLLSTLAHLPEVRKLDAKACDRLFHDLHTRYPFYSIILAVSPDGNVFAASTPLKPRSVNLPGGRYGGDAVGTLDFPSGAHIGKGGNNARLLGYAMSVPGVDGNPVAVVVVGFDVREYAGFVSKVSLPEGYAVTIADRRGVRLLRLPDNNLVTPGKSITRDAFTRLSGGFDQGFYEALGQDGVDRVYAFKKLRLSEGVPPYLYVIAGMAKDRVLHRQDLRMVRDLSILGAAALIALSLSWISGQFILVRPLGRLVESVQRFGKGEMHVRTGVPHTTDELGRLASAFDGMASQLEKRSREREDAERALSQAYAELETRVQERTVELSASNAFLAAQIEERIRAEEARQESESKYRDLVQHANSIIMRMDARGKITFFNEFAQQFFGYTEEEIRGRSAIGTIVPEYESTGRDLRDLIEDIGRNPDRYINSVNENIRRDGERVWIAWTNRLVHGSKGRVVEILCIGNDITERKRAEEALEERERELENKSASLEEANAALKVLLRHRDEDIKAMENTILANMKELVFPYVEKLGTGQLSETQRTYLSILESSLNDIVSPFLRTMTSVYGHFTPTEVQIANLIKDGKTSKEIAKLLNVCTGTVDAHRNNIRSKLGLSHKKSNLRTYLLSM